LNASRNELEGGEPEKDKLSPVAPKHVELKEILNELEDPDADPNYLMEL
jgi:hypothetical protein